MGLDMYMYAKEKEEQEDREALAYWRKHNALHAWMEDHWRAANPERKNETFNCIPFEMTFDLLNELEVDVRSNNLVPRDGFFFGGEDYDPAEEKKEDLRAIKLARKALFEGKRVYYDSWW